MRVFITKKQFTRAERIFAEYLKRNHIKYKTKIKVNGREIDFLIGRFIIEIDGHEQDRKKNGMLLHEGYNLIHFSNDRIYDHSFEEIIKQIINKYGSKCN